MPGGTVGGRIEQLCWTCCLILLAAFAQPGQMFGQAAPSQPFTDAQVRDKADGLLRQMTLDEKIAQLSQLPGFPIPEFKENVNESLDSVLKRVGAGSILWVPESKEINRLQHV